MNSFGMVGHSEAVRTDVGFSKRAYAAHRINSKLKGRTKQFRWLQANATKLSFLSTISGHPLQSE